MRLSVPDFVKLVSTVLGTTQKCFHKSTLCLDMKTDAGTQAVMCGNFQLLFKVQENLGYLCLKQNPCSRTCQVEHKHVGKDNRAIGAK